MIQYRTTLILAALTLGVSLAVLLACGQGGSSGTVNEVSFGISDAPVGELHSVTITIESMTVSREGDDDIVIDTFDTDAGEVDRVTLDLLDYQGSERKLIVDAFELEVGSYQNIRLEILDENTGDSYVLEIGNRERKSLKVPSDQLKLGGFEVEDDGPQTFIVEFDLARAMTYNPGPDRYILKPRGVRVVEAEAAALVRGVALSELLDDCDGNAPGHSNRVYLYQEHGLEVDDLGDVFDPDIDTGVSEEIIEPLAVDTLDAEGNYEVALIPAGDYTLAFSCNAEADDADYLDGIEVPSPVGQLVEISLDPGDEFVCNFGLGVVDCS